jgi:diguanylate cyclase
VTSPRTTLRSEVDAALAREALDLMLHHGIAPTSANYDLWLQHKSGANAGLSQAIEDHIAAGDTFTTELCARLHSRFMGAGDSVAQVVLTGQQMARDLLQVVDLLRRAEEKNGDYGRTLETAATDLTTALGPDQIGQIVSSLAAATLDMAQHNQLLSEQLVVATKEAEALRANLNTVRVESLTDSLTGLANRRMFDETLRMRIDEARALRVDLCLLLCDIDHFKRFNDTWGHHTGDQILRFLASTLQAHAMGDWLVARYGGEEFAMIMPRASVKAAAQSAEALRRAIQTKRLRRRSTNEDLGQVTVSMGIAQLQPADTPQGFVERADACLYASKRAGRDRVTTDASPVLYVA